MSARGTRRNNVKEGEALARDPRPSRPKAERGSNGQITDLHPQPMQGLRQQDHFLPHGSRRNLSNGAVEVGTFCRRIEVASRR